MWIWPQPLLLQQMLPVQINTCSTSDVNCQLDAMWVLAQVLASATVSASVLSKFSDPTMPQCKRALEDAGQEGDHISLGTPSMLTKSFELVFHNEMCVYADLWDFQNQTSPHSETFMYICMHANLWLCLLVFHNEMCVYADLWNFQHQTSPHSETFMCSCMHANLWLCLQVWNQKLLWRCQGPQDCCFGPWGTAWAALFLLHLWQVLPCQPSLAADNSSCGPAFRLDSMGSSLRLLASVQPVSSLQLQQLLLHQGPLKSCQAACSVLRSFYCFAAAGDMSFTAPL